MPLVRSWWLGKKKGKEAYVVPRSWPTPSHPSGKRVRFEIGHDDAGRRRAPTDGTVVGTARRASRARSAVAADVHPRRRDEPAGSAQQLMAIVAEGQRQRIYLARPTEHACGCRRSHRPETFPTAAAPADRRRIIRVQRLRHDQVGRPVHQPPADGADDVQRPRWRALVERVVSDGGTAEAYADAIADATSALGVSDAS